MLFRCYIFISLLSLVFIPVARASDELPGKEDPEYDTIRLEGLTIRGDYYERFSPGSIIQPSDSLTRSAFHAGNLDEIISFGNPIYFKSYGNGMLSSISFRGTGASHTAVLWNGVNINQPTVGQSDFSLFPVLAFDNIKVVYGSSSSKFGTDAIGGSILMGSSPDWNRDLGGHLGQYAGSFRNFLTTAKVRGKVGEKVYIASRFYRHQNDNDFDFRNITKPGEPTERQQNAAIFQYGVLQDIYIRTSSRSQLSINGWYNYSDREIQPTMVNQDAEDWQKDKSVRLVADYGYQSMVGFFQFKMAYLWDHMIYNGSSTISTSQYSGQINYEKSIEDWDIRVGGNFNHIVADVDNYEGPTTEDRTDVYGGVVNRSLRNTELSFNMRQTFVKGYNAPFSPSIGIRYHLVDLKKSLLYLAAQASINYRVPALNDRYWVPGGSTTLKPENSRNLDLSLGYQYTGEIRFETTLSTYYYNVDNWILWMPGPSYWIPENVRQVKAYGLDINSSAQLRSGILVSEVSANYGYSRSVVAGSYHEDDVGTGHQLPYTPLHVGSLAYNGSIRDWYAGLSINFTGMRYVTSDNSSELPAFYLLNVRAGKNISIGKQVLNIDFRINNLLNASYQNMKFRAMPGRNYMLGINFMFKK